jgi:hypothetical protein
VAAAGSAPDPQFPSDGIDITAAIAGQALPERSLFWRFSNHDQKAARRGCHKYLQIGRHAFLFDVVADPMERANLKARREAEFTALQDAWHNWNAAMLPPDPEAGRHGFTADKLAQYYGMDS